MSIMKILEAGRVRRFHNVDVHHKQPLSEHSWQVAVILLDIYPETNKNLLEYALVHDCGELLTGDIPAPYKAYAPHVAALVRAHEAEFMQEELMIPPFSFTDEERLALKLADILSGMYQAAYEVIGGNEHARYVYDEFVKYFEQQKYLNSRPIEFFQEIDDRVSKR